MRAGVLLTRKLANNIQESLSLAVLAVVRRMDGDVLLAQVEEHSARIVHDLLAAAERQDVTFDLEHRAAVDGFDVKRVAGEGNQLVEVR